MLGGRPIWSSIFTCAALLSGCSPPAPPAANTPAAATKTTPPIVPEASPEPPLAPADIAALSQPATGDLDAMSARGSIRVLVAPSQTDYFVASQQQRGSAFDIGKAFESFANDRLTNTPRQDRHVAETASKTHVTGSDPSHLRIAFIQMAPEQLLPALTAGRGDIIAGRFAKTYEREDIVAFSDPIERDVREVLVTGPGVTPIVSLEDVAGRSIHVRKGSDHFASLTRLNGQLAKIKKPTCKVIGMDPSLTDEDLLRLVNEGKVPVTLADQYLVAAWRPLLPKLAVNADVAVSQDGVYAWAVRKDSPQLLELVNRFIRSYRFDGLDARSAARWK